jgi:hypothetical protein
MQNQLLSEEDTAEKHSFYNYNLNSPKCDFFQDDRFSHHLTVVYKNNIWRLNKYRKFKRSHWTSTQNYVSPATICTHEVSIIHLDSLNKKSVREIVLTWLISWLLRKILQLYYTIQVWLENNVTNRRIVIRKFQHVFFHLSMAIWKGRVYNK